jgi:hypothetical protein
MVLANTSRAMDAYRAARPQPVSIQVFDFDLAALAFAKQCIADLVPVGHRLGAQALATLDRLLADAKRNT